MSGEADVKPQTLPEPQLSRVMNDGDHIRLSVLKMSVEFVMHQTRMTPAIGQLAKPVPTVEETFNHFMKLSGLRYSV